MTLASLALAGACAIGSDDQLDSPCSEGSALLAELHDDLQLNAPACQSDADCMPVGYGVECRGSKISYCGSVIHRDQLSRYQEGQERVREQFCALAERSTYGCSAQASCAYSRPACQAGRCASLQLMSASGPDGGALP